MFVFDSVTCLLFLLTSYKTIHLSVTAYGNLGDAGSAVWLFAHFPERSTRTWNVLLGTLAECGSRTRSLRPLQSVAAKLFNSASGSNFSSTFKNYKPSTLLRHSTIQSVSKVLLRAMTTGETIRGMKMVAPAADSQTFCVASSALQSGPTGAVLATELYRNATAAGVPADGRVINSILRCFGTDIDEALSLWKNEIRPRCVAYENRARPQPLSRQRPAGKNVLAAYNGLLYVCGRALRPDIAVRLIYAMNKEGLEPNENSLNSYRAGKRLADSRPSAQTLRTRLADTLKLIDPYESILYVECTKYDSSDRRRQGEKRVRIIL